jgi:hypothetical protein
MMAYKLHRVLWEQKYLSNLTSGSVSIGTIQTHLMGTIYSTAISTIPFVGSAGDSFHSNIPQE